MLVHRPVYALVLAALLVAPSAALVAQRAGAVAPLPPNQSRPEDFVRVTVNGVLGPMGFVATPSLASARELSGVDPEAILASGNFNFPSIILYISAVPVVYVPRGAHEPGDLDHLQAAQETNRNPLWLDASFRLTPEGADGRELPEACRDGRVQVLGLLPQQTVAATRQSTAGEIAGAATSAAGAIASFYPGAGAAATASTQALNVLFQDIFPPQPFAFQYSNMNGNCEFGWFFRPNNSGAPGGEASILGMQTGIILLKTSKDIARISVMGQTLSEWNKPPSVNSKKLFLSDRTALPTFTLPDPKNIDFDTLTNLASFPALISKDIAKKILHLTSDTDFDDFIKAHKIVSTNKANDFVTNASLTEALAVKSAPPPPELTTSKPPPEKPTGTPKPKHP